MVIDKNIKPVVKTIITRSISCTRCVRFAIEIAIVKNLSVFGKNLHNKTKTYVNKTFQSKISGNVINLCPVGALTSKPHSFVGRKWELKVVNSIDFSDGFGVDTQILIKNNCIVRIMPGFNTFDRIDYWITDKARFGFDGMFSAERKINILHVTGKKSKKKSKISWDFVFKELMYFMYFFSHLNRHASKLFQLVIIFSNNVSLEVASLLQILAKKYSLFQLKKDIKTGPVNNDMEAYFQLNVIENILLLTKYCILIGVNTRFEGSSLNIKLKQRYKKGNFKLFSLGSLTDLTYPIFYLGSTLKSFKLLVEGNSINCQELNSVHYPPLTIHSSEVYSRNDNNAIFELMSILKYQTTNFVAKYCNSKMNVLNSRINEVGLNVLNRFNSFNIKDFKNSRGIYLINTTTVTSVSIQKLLELKLLEYFYVADSFQRVLIDQNNTPSGLINFNNNQYYNVYSYLFLPTNVFFETNNTYINTEGFIKKTLKSVLTTNDTKSDWQILRKFFSYSNFLSIGSIKPLNKKIQFDCYSLFNFKSFISFLYYSAENLNNLGFYLIVKNMSFDFKRTKFTFSVQKVCNTTFKRWLDDFYLGSNNTYSNYSYTMVNCSVTFRKILTNFINKYIF